MSKRTEKKSTVRGPASPSLERAVVVRRIARRGRSWASRRRQLLEPMLPKLREALESGLSKREIRELLASDGIRVGRWMLDDLLRDNTDGHHSLKPATPDA